MLCLVVVGVLVCVGMTALWLRDGRTQDEISYLNAQVDAIVAELKRRR